MNTANISAKVFRNGLIIWVFISLLILLQCAWIYARHGLDGFQAYVQDSPFTYTPLALLSAAFVWSLAGLLLWLIHTERINKANLFSWTGFFIVSISYLNIHRERVRYGDIGYYN